MRTVAVMSLMLSVGLLARAEDKKAETPKIAGSYTLVSGKKDGEKTSEDAKKGKYTFDDKKITIAGKDGKFVMSYKLDGKKIDMEILEAPFEGLKGAKAYGIVEAKGDTLKLAYATEKADDRPKDFDGKKGFAFEFKKDKEKPKE
jgi:uncharacterized protein (TIGR03067 family)